MILLYGISFEELKHKDLKHFCNGGQMIVRWKGGGTYGIRSKPLYYRNYARTKMPKKIMHWPSCQRV